MITQVLCVSLTADIISTVEFNHDGELLATGDKGGRVVIFQREEQVRYTTHLERGSQTCKSLSCWGKYYLVDLQIACLFKSLIRLFHLLREEAKFCFVTDQFKKKILFGVEAGKI